MFIKYLTICLSSVSINIKNKSYSMTTNKNIPKISLRYIYLFKKKPHSLRFQCLILKQEFSFKKVMKFNFFNI